MLIWICPVGKGEDKFGSYALCADYIDILAVRLDNLFYNGKAKSGSFLVLSAGQIRLIEALPDLGQCASRDSNSVVLDGGVNLITPVRGLDGDVRTRITELHRVV